MSVNPTTNSLNPQVKAEVLASGPSVSAAVAANNAAAALGPKQLTPRPPQGATPSLLVTDLIQGKAAELTANVIGALGGRAGVLEVVNLNEQRNAPCAYPKEVKERKAASLAVIAEAASKLTPGMTLDKALDFNGLMEMDRHLADKGIPLDSEYTADAADVTLENFCERFLSGVKDGDSIRILEPGNNDQTTPIVLADAIEKMKGYLTEKGIQNVSIEVLVLGEGGHATTALFDQIGHVESGVFSGVPEAESLGNTLKAALMERGIEASESDITTRFDKKNVGFSVEIKKERSSRNTGQNVAAVTKAWESFSEDQDYFVVAATTANRRQVQTFAHQMVPPYGKMIGLPMVRSQKFMDAAFDDKALVTECLAGLAERARSFAYMFLGKDGFIPLSRIDAKDLDSLYKSYAALSGKEEKEAKSTSIADVQKFFSEQFTVMEKAIAENIYAEEHSRKVLEKIISILTRVKESTAQSPGDVFRRFVEVLSFSPAAAIA